MPDNVSVADFFNKNLKGKYAYWVQMRYIFPLNSMDLNTYTTYEQYDQYRFNGADVLPFIDMQSTECNNIDFRGNYVDVNETNKVNSVKKYMMLNNYVTDEDIDINELRLFRTWLATELLSFSAYTDTYSTELIHMLEYYKNGMYNDVIKYLSVFGQSDVSLTSNTTGCGCCNTNVSSLYKYQLNDICDAQQVYINNIHRFMVETFEDVNFWKQFSKDFIKVFKRYIDNIIKVGFVINPVKQSSFVDCQCGSNNSNTEMLRNLSETLQYIIDNDINGHSNFIYDSLHNWAEYLYEHMIWNK